MGSRIRRRAVAAIISVIGLASLPSLPVGAASGPKVPTLAAGTYHQLPAAEIVNVRQLRAAAPGAHPSFARPRLVRNPKAPTLPSPAGGVGKLAPAMLPSLASGRTLTGTTQGTVLEQLTAFPAMDITTGVALFGAKNNIEPPDTQVAAGPDVVVEMVNANMTVWSKSGTMLVGADLNTFYNVPVGFSITDPRVLYDRGSGRFIASALAYDSSWNSYVYLAVSRTSDPTGAWAKQVVRSTAAVLVDQPKVGTSDDKITLVWSEWVKPPCANQATYPCFIGEVFTAVDKVDMLGIGPAVQYLSGRDASRFAVLPVQALSSTTTQYMVYNNADPYYLVENNCFQPNPPNQYGTCPTIGILSLTGSVHASTLALSEVFRPINSTTAPPQAAQPGSTAVIDTGDDRLLTAVWQNNQLWTSSGDGNFCPTANPNGLGANACALIIEVRTDTNPMTVVMDGEINSGDFLFHPAISLDTAGDAYVVLSRSSSTSYGSVWVTGMPVATPGMWSTLALLAAGTGLYDSKTACGGMNRWGDYSGASVDGRDTTDMWVAGEYALSDPVRNCTWKTALGRLTYSAPTVTSITPATGPGGTAVTITGTDFLSGNTTPYFGTTPSGSGTTTVQSPNSLTTTAPPGNGWVQVSAATPDGHGPNGPTYKYPRLEVAPGTLAAPAGAAARGNAPPPVPQKSAGPRPLTPTPPSPPGGGVQPSPIWEWTLQLMRLLRLLLL